MTEAEKTGILKKPTKKETQKEVFEKLSGALAEYKSKLNEKKFENKLKKASKLFAVDIVKAIKKDRKKLPCKANQAIKNNYTYLFTILKTIVPVRWFFFSSGMSPLYNQCRRG